MRLPRVRFTVRRIMVAVAIVGVLLVVETGLFQCAAWAVRSHPSDPDYFLNDAIMVFVAMNAALIWAVGIAIVLGWVVWNVPAEERPKCASDEVWSS
jgi:hypothetical protein